MQVSSHLQMYITTRQHTKHSINKMSSAPNDTITKNHIYKAPHTQNICARKEPQNITFIKQPIHKIFVHGKNYKTSHL